MIIGFVVNIVLIESNFSITLATKVGQLSPEYPFPTYTL